MLLKSSALIKNSFDQMAAIITNTDGDFEKRAFDMLPTDLKKRFCLKSVAKEPALAKDIEAAHQEVPEQQPGPGNASSSSVGGRDEAATPASSRKRRRITKTLSDVSIPDGLRANDADDRTVAQE